VYKRAGQVNTFQDFIDNLFRPLFEVTRDPGSDPKLYKFLLKVWHILQPFSFGLRHYQAIFFFFVFTKDFRT
jgi:hypothetical protein